MAIVRFTIVVRPQRAEAVWSQLAELDCVTDLHAWESRGVGRRDESGPAVFEVLPKAVIEGFIEREDCDTVIEAVISHARTGRSGDGKIFITAIPEE